MTNGVSYSLDFKYRSNLPIALTTYTRSPISGATFDPSTYAYVTGTANTGNCISQAWTLHPQVSTYVGFIIGVWLTSTSTSPITIPTSTGTVSFVTQQNLKFVAGISVRLTADGSHYFYGTITSYNPSTGDMTVSWISNIGTGSFSSWTIQYTYGGWFEIDEVNLYQL